ncbi:hypothetical protein PCIT_a2648 [Pseudoalteromonas citrea]|uniref:Uncharacterized protein n=2 Tax=Pseudoalteromonas citrea TaxID=43655 RepID=A0AAD4AHC5_9GAMM|nr:hypothetical protein [Pseudoalteromonas citrea]KAF7769752.1 hypothetical protein PCIT_a2648 [Pseudoalteromonas citrea]
MKIPSQLREVLGTHQSGTALSSIGLMTIFGCYVLYVLFVQQHTLPDIDWWQWAIGDLLIIDVVAGCVANFTKGTNDYYKARPQSRWVFIAIHFHIVVIAWSYNIALNESLIIWGYTIVSAAVLNTFYGHKSQAMIAMGCIFLGVMVIASLPSPVWFQCIAGLFLIKVCFAFSVDHYPNESAEQESKSKKNPI